MTPATKKDLIYAAGLVIWVITGLFLIEAGSLSLTLVALAFATAHAIALNKN